jgi:hypothetical protein
MFDDGLRALQAANQALFEVVAADIQYLLTLKREAELPQVRWGIAQSEFTDVTGEVRSHVVGEPEFVRVLFVMPPDESICVFAVIGDKNTADGNQGNDWYDHAVPILDEVWRRVQDDSGLT